ncbi:MAG: DNA polymerase IV [Puniceicoccales bacterium]|jgi:DNA polymerase-4|nr:DNA polymerase IV [Puniceicoccales bacterium]
MLKNEAGCRSYPAMTRPLPTIVHLDADAFFVAVEQVLNPALRGKKVAVGGRERGIISSASYEARACGVYTPMPTAQALRICPDLILSNSGKGLYGEFSEKLFALCEKITPLVERRSIDEGFLDVGPRGFADEPALTTAMRNLQERILRELGLPISFGLATNKLVAAVASKQNKPRGFTVIKAGNEAAFLAPLPVGTLPGIGKKTEILLKSNGINQVGDLIKQSDSLLSSLLGSNWRGVVAMSQGIDFSEVSTEYEDAKSYSRQETFPRDISDFPQILHIAKGMIDILVPKLRADGKRARTLTVKVRYSGMIDDSAGHSLAEASDMETPFYALAENLLHIAWRRRNRPLRLVMVKLSGIEDQPRQLELFTEENESLARKRRLASVVDALNARATGTKIRHGHQVDSPPPPCDAV